MASPLERLWRDTMDVYRFAESTAGNITSETLPGTPLYTGLKCHYSKDGLAPVGQTNGPSITNTHTLFCSADADVREGDVVTVTQRDGTKVTLTVGEGAPYGAHRQFAVKRDDMA